MCMTAEDYRCDQYHRRTRQCTSLYKSPNYFKSSEYFVLTCIHSSPDTENISQLVRSSPLPSFPLSRLIQSWIRRKTTYLRIPVVTISPVSILHSSFLMLSTIIHQYPTTTHTLHNSINNVSGQSMLPHHTHNFSFEKYSHPSLDVRNIIGVLWLDSWMPVWGSDENVGRQRERDW